MKFAEIKVIDRGGTKELFINGIKQENVARVTAEILPGEITLVKVSYVVDKFEIVRSEAGYVEQSEKDCGIEETDGRAGHTAQGVETGV